MSVVNELLWSRFPEVYLAIVGLVILAVVLFMPRGIVTFLSRRSRSWLPLPRGDLRRLADRLRPVAAA
jgi:branched-chain amino acid transport system permease protein